MIQSVIHPNLDSVIHDEGRKCRIRYCNRGNSDKITTHWKMRWHKTTRHERSLKLLYPLLILEDETDHYVIHTHSCKTSSSSPKKYHVIPAERMMMMMMMGLFHTFFRFDPPCLSSVDRKKRERERKGAKERRQTRGGLLCLKVMCVFPSSHSPIISVSYKKCEERRDDVTHTGWQHRINKKLLIMMIIIQ